MLNTKHKLAIAAMVGISIGAVAATPTRADNNLFTMLWAENVATTCKEFGLVDDQRWSIISMNAEVAWYNAVSEHGEPYAWRVMEKALDLAEKHTASGDEELFETACAVVAS